MPPGCWSKTYQTMKHFKKLMCVYAPTGELCCINVANNLLNFPTMVVNDTSSYTNCQILASLATDTNIHVNGHIDMATQGGINIFSNRSNTATPSSLSTGYPKKRRRLPVCCPSKILLPSPLASWPQMGSSSSHHPNTTVLPHVCIQQDIFTKEQNCCGHSNGPPCCLF